MVPFFAGIFLGIKSSQCSLLSKSSLDIYNTEVRCPAALLTRPRALIKNPYLQDAELPFQDGY